MAIQLFIITILISLASFSQTLGAVDVCITNGDCQLLLPSSAGAKCFVVKTGLDPVGEQQCALRCYSAQLGSYCKSIPGEIFGHCKYEAHEAAPAFDINDPNRCDEAVNPL